MLRKTHIISEIGINHNGNIEIAKEMMYRSKECGVDSVKLQTYTMDERALPGSKYYDLFKRCMLSYDEQERLFSYANKIGIDFFSTPFGKKSLDFLIDIGVKRIKIASFDVTNKEFLRSISKKAKRNNCDIIMSIGMANYHELNDAMYNLTYKESKMGFNLHILHCVSSYPMKDSDANLKAISKIKKMFCVESDSFFIKDADSTKQIFYNGHKIKPGYSDHSQGIDVPATSVFFGAKIIEKHFTLDLNGDYIDNPVSADPEMMRELVKRVGTYEAYIGDGEIKMSESELAALGFRRK